MIKNTVGLFILVISITFSNLVSAQGMNPLSALPEAEKNFVIAVGQDLNIDLDNQRGFDYHERNIKPYLEITDGFSFMDSYIPFTEGDLKNDSESGRSTGFSFILDDRIVSFTNIYYEHNDVLFVEKREIIPATINTVMQRMEILSEDENYRLVNETDSSATFRSTKSYDSVILKIGENGGLVIYNIVDAFD